MQSILVQYCDEAAWLSDVGLLCGCEWREAVTSSFVAVSIPTVPTRLRSSCAVSLEIVFGRADAMSGWYHENIFNEYCVHAILRCRSTPSVLGERRQDLYCALLEYSTELVPPETQKVGVCTIFK